MYAQGRGVDRDDAQAVRLYRLAAEEGDAKVYRLAAEGGDALGRLLLGSCTIKDKASSMTIAQAVRLYSPAAKKGECTGAA